MKTYYHTRHITAVFLFWNSLCNSDSKPLVNMTTLLCACMHGNLGSRCKTSLRTILKCTIFHQVSGRASFTKIWYTFLKPVILPAIPTQDNIPHVAILVITIGMLWGLPLLCTLAYLLQLDFLFPRPIGPPPAVHVGKVEIVFSFDTTSSMSRCLDQVLHVQLPTALIYCMHAFLSDSGITCTHTRIILYEDAVPEPVR